MVRSAFFLGGALFLAAVAIDAGLIFQGAMLIGIFLLVSTILVFSSGMIWLIHRPDEKLHIKRVWLIIPLSCFAVGILQVLKMSQVNFQATSEEITEAGNLLMARYQAASWLIGMIILTVFIIASALLEKRA